MFRLFQAMNFVYLFICDGEDCECSEENKIYRQNVTTNLMVLFHLSQNNQILRISFQKNLFLKRTDENWISKCYKLQHWPNNTISLWFNLNHIKQYIKLILKKNKINCATFQEFDSTFLEIKETLRFTEIIFVFRLIEMTQKKSQKIL